MKKILIVDDEPDIQSLYLQRFRRKLENKEWDFVFASSGEAALKAIAKNPDIQLVLTDINMPGMDGLELLGKIKALSYKTEVVVVSAYGDMKNIRKSMNRGAFDFITKPLDFEDLEAVVLKTYRHIEVFHQSIENQTKLLLLNKELETAKALQESIFPSPLPPDPRFELKGTVLSSQPPGGDYYDFLLTDGDQLSLAVASVSGKGFSSILFSSLNQSFLKGFSENSLSPKQCLQKLNKLFAKNNKHCMFATALYGILKLSDGEFVYSNAGKKNFLYKISPQNSVHPQNLSEGPPIGLSKEAQFSEIPLGINQGDSLFLCTEGLTSVENKQGEHFGEESLKEILAETAKLSAEQTSGLILQALEKFLKGEEPKNDICFISVKYKG